MLENTRDDSVWNPVAVLSPVDGVFLAAFLVVAECSMDEENSEEYEVGVRHNVCECRGHGPQEGEQQLGQVVEVPRQAPVAGHQEKTVPLLAACHCVLGPDHVRSTAPHETISVGAADVLFLLVGQVIDDDGCNAGRDYRQAQDRTEIEGVVDHIETDRGVQAGDEDQTAPADVEAGAVQHDVDGAHVARLPPEELGEVDHLQRHRHPHAVDEARQFVALQAEDEHQQRPDGHAETAVGEHLHVDAEHARVQLSAPVVVEDQIAGRAAVR